MHTFATLIPLLLLLTGLCGGRRWRNKGGNHHRTSPSHHRSVDKRQQCAGNSVPVRCGDLSKAGVNRYCPMYAGGTGRRRRQSALCSAKSDRHRGTLCACTMPNRINARGNCVPARQCHRCDRATEVHSRCRAHCQPTCDRPLWRRRRARKVCGRRCRPGCVCRKGYLRDRSSGKCVTRNMCSSDATMPLKCTGNKVVVRCSDMNNNDVNQYCPIYELNYRARSKPYCYGESERRGTTCACRLPYRIDVLSRSCTLMEDCTACGANEEFSECDLHHHTPCSMGYGGDCYQGCVCKSGHVRDKESGKCLPWRILCPNVAAPEFREPLRCAGGRVPMRCGEIDGADVNRYCPMYEVAKGYKSTERCSSEERLGIGTRCGCRLPYRVTDSAACMHIDRCPTCAPTETYSECAAHCEPSCDEPLGPRPCSTMLCVAGCVCSMGYLRDKASGKCVPNKMCTVMTTVAPAPTAKPPGTCWSAHECPPCHKCMVNRSGHFKCVYKGACGDEFPDTDCPPGQNLCHTIIALCAMSDCANGYTCVNNYCECKPVYYDPHLNQVDKCHP